MGGGQDSSSKSSYPVLAPRPVGQWISKLYKDRLHQFTSMSRRIFYRESARSAVPC